MRPTEFTCRTLQPQQPRVSSRGWVNLCCGVFFVGRGGGVTGQEPCDSSFRGRAQGFKRKTCLPPGPLPSPSSSPIQPLRMEGDFPFLPIERLLVLRSHSKGWVSELTFCLDWGAQIVLARLCQASFERRVAVDGSKSSRGVSLVCGSSVSPEPLKL